MDIFEATAYIQNSDEFAGASFEDKVKIKQDLMNSIGQTDVYRSFNMEQRATFRKQFMTDIAGFRPEDITGDEAEDKAARSILADVQNARETGQSNLDGWDGFVEGTRNFLSGKIGAGIVDIFTEGDTTEALFGDKRKEVEKFREYAYKMLDPEGLADYKAGKIFGNVAGFATDAISMGYLYGGVGAAGLLTRPLSGISARLLQSAGKTFGQKVLSKGLVIGGQALLESGGFVIEEAISNKIIGNLENDQEIQSFIQSIPSKFLQGLGYFAFGEIMGVGLSKAISTSKSLGRVFTGNGARPESFVQTMNKTSDDIVSSMRSILAGDEDAVIRAKLNALKAGDLDEKTINQIYEGTLAAKALNDPDLMLKDEAELQQLAWKIMYKMDTERIGDAVRVTSFNGEAITPRTFDNDADLSKFIAESYQGVNNQIFESTAKIASDKTGTIKVEALSVGGKTSSDFSNQEILSVFRPEANLTDPTKLKTFAEKYISKDFKIQQVDDYFVAGKKIMAADGTIYVPKKVTTSYQSSKFADDFFSQISKNTDGRFEFDLKSVNSLLRDTGNVKYTKPFIERLVGKDGVKFHKDGITDIIQNGEVVYRATSLDDAGAFVHSREFTEAEVASFVKKKSGYTMQKDGESVILKGDKGETVKTFPTLGDLFKDEAYRPNIPFEKRPAYFAIDYDVAPGEIATFKTGTVDDITKGLREYSKTGKTSIDGKTHKAQKFTYDPKWNRYKVTLGDTGYSKEFSTLESAERWLKKDLDDYSTLTEDAIEKGFMIQPVKNGYYIFSPNMEKKFAPSLTEAKKAVAELDDVRNVKDLMDDLPEDGIQTIREAKAIADDIASKRLKELDMRYDKYKTKTKSVVRKQLEKLFVPIRERIEGTGNKEVMGLFDQLVSADRGFREEYARLKQQMQGLFHGRNKYSAKQLSDMGRVLGKAAKEGSDDWATVAKEAGIKLDDAQLDTMEAFRGIMDTAGTRFGVEPSMWLERYFPHVVERDPSDLHKLIQFDVLKAAEGGGHTEIGDEFFKHMRSEDWISSVYENNIETVMDVYMRTGLRKQYLGSITDNVSAYLKNADLNLEETLLLKEATDKVAGQIYSTERAKEMLARLEHNHERAKAIMEGEGKYKKLTEEQRYQRAQNALNSNYQQFANSLVTSALMSFKMKMPIRNVSQIFTVLSPLADAEYVTHAMRSLDSKDIQQKLYKEYHAKGIIKPRDVRPNYGPWAQKSVNHLNSFGMAQFYNSDDFTRLVAAKSASDRFRDGLDLWKKRELSTEKFAEFMNIDFLSEVDQSRFLNLLADRKFEVAETLIQRRWADMTMFDYDILNKPQGLTSGLGKVLGQYSTYPLSYLQFMKRGMDWRKRGLGKSIGFGVKAVMATSIIAAFYNDVLNIGGLDALPTGIATFTGGPMITTGAKVMSTFGGYADPKTKAKIILDEVKRISIPLYGISTSQIKAMEAFKEAEYWDGVTRVLGASPSDESYVEKFSEILK